MNAEQLQSHLMQHSALLRPGSWPQWLIIPALAWLGLCVLLALHALLRYRSPHPVPHGEKQCLYLYPRALRLWHALNALLFLFLLFSGLLTHFSLPPPAITRYLVKLHPYAGYLLVALYAGFMAINLLGDNGKHYRVHWQGLPARSLSQARFYLIGIFRGEPHPFAATATQKFNPLQQMGYCSVMFGMVPALLLSGLAITLPEIFPEGMAYWILQGHLLFSLFILIFITAHIYLCTLGETPGETFMAMLDGYHRHRTHHAEK